ncbi:MAG: hypothetical protein WAL56_04480 [Candidatus Sulfotelmatobacter sp.]
MQILFQFAMDKVSELFGLRREVFRDKRARCGVLIAKTSLVEKLVGGQYRDASAV